MIMRFLRRLAGSASAGNDAPSKHDAVEFEGYRIVPAPRKVSGGWSTEGVISREIDGEVKVHKFIRADVTTSESEAAAYSITKAKRVVDEQGDRMFEDT